MGGSDGSADAREVLVLDVINETLSKLMETATRIEGQVIALQASVDSLEKKGGADG